MDGWDVRIIVIAATVSVASATFGGTWRLVRRFESQVVKVSISIAVASAVVAIGWRVLGPLVLGLDRILPYSLAR